MGVRFDSLRGLLEEVFCSLIPGRMMHPQDRRTPIPVGHAMEGREALVIQDQAERVKTAHRFVGDASMPQCPIRPPGTSFCP